MIVYILIPKTEIEILEIIYQHSYKDKKFSDGYASMNELEYWFDNDTPSTLLHLLPYKLRESLAISVAAIKGRISITNMVLLHL